MSLEMNFSMLFYVNANFFQFLVDQNILKSQQKKYFNNYNNVFLFIAKKYIF